MVRLLASFLFAFVLSAAPPQRIISTTPSITEILYALGAGDRVVGVTTFCRYPAEAQQKPKIGDYIHPNLEAITALRPDLVIIQNNPVRLAERLSALHLRSLEVKENDLTEITLSIREIGSAIGASAAAEKLVQSMQARIAKISGQAATSPHARVLFIVGRHPGSLDGLIAAGPHSYVNEIIELAGAKNIFPDARLAYPQVTFEEVLARDPDIIIDFGDMANPSLITEDHKREIVSLWRRRAASLRAAREGRVYAVAADVFVVPGPRAVVAVETVFGLLHGERKQ